MDSSVVASSDTLGSTSFNLTPKDLIFLKREHFYANYRHQNFALPDSIMHYITKNPATPEGYQSLIQSCKYFFIKNSIIIQSQAYYDGEMLQNCESYRNICILVADFISKFWLTDQFVVSPFKLNTTMVSFLIPKIYCCNVKKLNIRDQDVSFVEYIYLSSSAGAIYFKNVIVKDEKDSIVALEELIQTAVKAIDYTFFSKTTLSNITSKTAKELFENPKFLKLKNVRLNHIPEAFDTDVFYRYMKKNKTTNFDLHFDDTISDAYKNRLDSIIDEILATQTFHYKPPLLSFRGMNREKCLKLSNIYYFHR